MRKDTWSVCHLKITYPTDHSRGAVCDEWYAQYLLSFLSIWRYVHNIKGTLRPQQVGGVWKIPPKVSSFFISIWYALCNIRGSRRASRSAAEASRIDVQYIWVQEWSTLLNTLPIVIVTFAIDCWVETSPIHLLGFALKLDVDKIRANRSYSCETILWRHY